MQSTESVDLVLVFSSNLDFVGRFFIRFRELKGVSSSLIGNDGSRLPFDVAQVMPCWATGMDVVVLIMFR